MVVVTLSCPSCGASLDISPDIENFACSYCGSNNRVERRGGTVQIKEIENIIRAIQNSTERTAAELAIVRLKKELSSQVALVASLGHRPSDLAPTKPNLWFLALGAWLFVIGIIGIAFSFLFATCCFCASIGSIWLMLNRFFNASSQAEKKLHAEQKDYDKKFDDAKAREDELRKRLEENMKVVERPTLNETSNDVFSEAVPSNSLEIQVLEPDNQESEWSATFVSTS